MAAAAAVTLMIHTSVFVWKVHGGRRDWPSCHLFQWRLLSFLVEITGQRVEDPAGECITSRGGIRLLVFGIRGAFQHFIKSVRFNIYLFK